MAIAYGGAGARLGQSPATTTWNVAYPAGVVAGDLLVLHFSSSGGSFSPVPTGWTEQHRETTIQNPRGGILTKIANGTESGTLLVETYSTTGNMIMHRYTGVDGAVPLDAATTSVSESALVTSLVIPSVTTVTAGAMLVYAGAGNSGSVRMSSTTGTERFDFGQTGGTGAKAGALYDEPAAATGATGTRTITMDSARAGWGFMMALRPDQGGAPPAAGTLTQRVVGIAQNPSTEGVVQVKVASTTSARLICSTDAAQTLGVVYGAPVTPDGEGHARLTVAGLTPDTRYYYRVEMTDAAAAISIDDKATIGRIKTAPTGQANFAFDFGSCANSTDPAVFPLITARNDDLFFHLGDMFYNDGSGSDVANLRSKMNGKINQPNHSALYSQVNMLHVPGDHDVTTNDTTNATDPTAWANWRQVSGELFPDPSLYYTFVWGRVRFIKLDLFNYKDDPVATDNASKSALGATQKQWLKDTVDAASEPLIIIVQSDPWIGAAITSDSGWFGFTTERTEIAGHLAASGKNIALIGGDMHAAAADDGTNSPGGIAVFAASPFSQTASQKGGPYTAGPVPASGTALTTHYGRVVVTDTGSDIQLAFNAYDSTNTSVVALTKTYNAIATTTVSPAGLVSAEGVGSPTASSTLTASPAGIASGQGLGAPAVSSQLTTSPAGIASVEAPGAPAVSSQLTTSPAGIASVEAPGAPAVSSQLTTSPAGIASGQAFGSPTIPRSKASSLSDSFRSGLDTGKWDTPPAPVTFSGGTVTFPVTSSWYALRSRVNYDLTDSAIAAEVLTVPNASNGSTEGILGISHSIGNDLAIYWSNGDIVFRQVLNSQYSDERITYSPTDHRWWRLRESGGTIHWETSPNNIDWTSRRSAPAPFSVQDVELSLVSGTWNNAPDPGVFEVDNFNHVPDPAPLGIASQESFGSPAISWASTVSPAGIASAETLGAPDLSLPVSADGIGSTEAFGAPRVSVTRVVSPAGIPSLEAVSSPSLSTITVLFAQDIPSAGTVFGTPSVSTHLEAGPAGIPSGAALGVPAITERVLTLEPASALSREAFGTVRVIGGSASTPYEMEGAMGARRHSGRLSAPGTTSQQPNRWEGRLG